jgi:hypothetical protein
MVRRAIGHFSFCIVGVRPRAERGASDLIEFTWTEERHCGLSYDGLAESAKAIAVTMR